MKILILLAAVCAVAVVIHAYFYRKPHDDPASLEKYFRRVGTILGACVAATLIIAAWPHLNGAVDVLVLLALICCLALVMRYRISYDFDLFTRAYDQCSDDEKRTRRIHATIIIVSLVVLIVFLFAQ
ncbi:MAG: hypothetical protein FWF20_04005 [Betaproteobacteria bacterium]|nr:hypothetical protein [Betaproteobacteria bacterium]MCL2885942.1 hypothetical protein [Betaproteobacteria bacterium]